MSLFSSTQPFPFDSLGLWPADATFAEPKNIGHLPLFPTALNNEFTGHVKRIPILL